MKSAHKTFLIEERTISSPYVERIWRAQSEPLEGFVSVAKPQWVLVVTRQRERSSVTIRGPETRASVSGIPQDAEFVGIDFKLGAFMRDLPPIGLVDAALELPPQAPASFNLNGTMWETPTYDNIDVFLRKLAGSGRLALDPVVEAALRGERSSGSARSVQRRVKRATGLTQGAIRQIVRAKQATAQLERGRTISEVVELLGYADAAHLSRSVRRFMGQTPSAVAGS